MIEKPKAKIRKSKSKSKKRNFIDSIFVTAKVKKIPIPQCHFTQETNHYYVTTKKAISLRNSLFVFIEV